MTEVSYEEAIEAMGLVEERDSWRQEFERNEYQPFIWLENYKLYRNSKLWRSTRELERMCEYILWLEERCQK